MVTPLTTARPDLDQRTDEETRTGSPKVAHIVKTEPGESALARVTEARSYGYPVEAFCRERFVPQRDTKKLQMGGTCKESYDQYRLVGGGGMTGSPGHPPPLAMRVEIGRG